MKLSFNLTNILILIIGVFLLFLLFRKDNQIVNVSRPKIVISGINHKETIIKGQERVVNNDKNIIAKLQSGFFDLQEQLELVKNNRDTFNIIQVQDTMISVLYKQGLYKSDVIARQDTIITAQRFIINSKDTLLAIKDNDLKRVKRQRNWSFIGNGILTGLLIIK